MPGRQRSLAPSAAGARRRLSRRVLLASALGNVLEWYDFGLYGLLAPVLAAQFFPSAHRLVALLDVYGGFAAGFAMRPLGAAVFGHWGDRIGRRFLLIASVVMMGSATVAMGLLPVYAAWGVWAPVLLMLIRLLQGFSVGGEFVGSVTYLVEHAPARRRGLAGSTANLGATVGLLLGAAAAALATTGAAGDLARSQLWRIPFLLGGVLAVAALLLRRHLPESAAAPAGPRPREPAEPPLRQAIRRAPRMLLVLTLFTSGYGIADYLTMVFLPTFAHEFGHVSVSTALRINTAGQALALVLIPLAGWLSDSLLRRRTLLVAAFALEAVFAWAGFAWVRHPSLAGLWIAQLGFAALLALVMGAAPALQAELFPPAYRVSAHAVAFNIGIGVAGGTAPLLAVALIRATAQPMAAAAYLIAASVLAAAAAALLPDRSREPLLTD